MNARPARKWRGCISPATGRTVQPVVDRSTVFISSSCGTWRGAASEGACVQDGGGGAVGVQG